MASVRRDPDRTSRSEGTSDNWSRVLYPRRLYKRRRVASGLSVVFPPLILDITMSSTPLSSRIAPLDTDRTVLVESGHRVLFVKNQSTISRPPGYRPSKRTSDPKVDYPIGREVPGFTQ